MAKMYTKSSPTGETYLYNGEGKLVGRGHTDPSGTTRFTGDGGNYIGRSDSGLFGRKKMFASDGSYLGSTAERFGKENDDIFIFDCEECD